MKACHPPALHSLLEIALSSFCITGSWTCIMPKASVDTPTFSQTKALYPPTRTSSIRRFLRSAVASLDGSLGERRS
ncbi:hypothetical protein BJ508DRAFT_115435 [Ascobolus immersus RN42]|uniref:Secreted protein n=1 Tax=Ascobolus immersus RN42 TaxID=1160509 RepID=A0A3N4I537_ASCIM|nr:hypothetical protein BJ508DRAFT_115435 [Ascobolus immersus RN42]